MANTIDFILTNAAKELSAKVLNGKILNFTRMAIGDGYSFDTNVAKGFITLVNEVLSLDITKKEVLDEESVKITSAFSNTDADAEFYYREVGLFAEDPDTKEEVLYAYGNRNDAAELITPAGNNIVTKQLMFIVTVGDSANVTFNVNQDIYALQTDMVDVQTDINQVQTDIEEIQNNVEGVQNNIEGVQNNITTLQTGKADKNLVNTGMITNCLLEVPQHIKLELSSGIITLKAGSKVYIPNGFEIDGTTPKFDEVTTTKDMRAEGAVEQRKFVYSEQTAWNTNALNHFNTNITAGPTQPVVASGNRLWYDTVNNYMMSSSNGGVTWVKSRSSLPVCLATNVISESSGVIDQVFNGFGYLDKVTFVTPGVKGLIPNGRNNDGTLNNIEHTVSRVIINEWGTEGFTGTVDYVITKYDTIDNSSVGFYISNSNFLINNSYKNIVDGFVFANGKRTNGVINSFNTYRPFQAVNYADYFKKIAELEARLSALENI